MTLSMHQASVPVFAQGLTGLSRAMDKAAVFAAERKFDPANFLQARLAPDMFSFARQVQIACDFAKGAVARLAGEEPPVYEDNEASLEALKDRVERTKAYIQGIAPGLIEGSEDRDITLVRRGEATVHKGHAYLLHQALPNFYFHTTAAYALLRQSGVPLGKKDFLAS